nr:MAG TPA: hypothetical protein [Caudoviricetes sp.]
MSLRLTTPLAIKRVFIFYTRKNDTNKITKHY